MARINLLPWREELRKKRQQEFMAALGLSVVLGLVVLFFIHSHYDGLKAYQDQRNQMLQNEIVVLDKKIVDIKDIEEKKKKLLAKIDLIQQLQESRPKIVHLFDEIPKATPDGVYLTRLVQTGSELLFEGKSQSNARISAFMRAIEASFWLQTPALNVIQTPDKGADKNVGEPLSDFTLHAKQGTKANLSENGGANEPIGH